MIQLVLIAGGSCSGKTTLADALTARAKPGTVTLICMDNYYRDQRHLSLDERKHGNYDHPDAIDSNLLIEHVTNLLAGHSIESPVYDFAMHTRSDETVLVDPSPVIIVEGIFALWYEALLKLAGLRLYVAADDDLRLMRRLERDSMRGRSIPDVLRQYRETVKPMHIKFVDPTKVRADLLIPGWKPFGQIIDIIADGIFAKEPGSVLA